MYVYTGGTVFRGDVHPFYGITITTVGTLFDSFFFVDFRIISRVIENDTKITGKIIW